MRLRQGRTVGRTLYAQTGPEPSDDDTLVGMVDTAELAAVIVEAVNTLIDEHDQSAPARALRPWRP